MWRHLAGIRHKENKTYKYLDSTTSYEKYLLSPFSVWAILVWEYWNPKICNKKVTTRLWYAKRPYWYIFEGIGPRAIALGPILPKVCQYGPLAYHSRGITYKYYKVVLVIKQNLYYIQMTENNNVEISSQTVTNLLTYRLNMSTK